jgi:O-antigen/teichoic acid export membrane protein
MTSTSIDHVDDSLTDVDGTPDRAPRQRSSVLRNVTAMLGGQAMTWVISAIPLVLVPRRLGSAMYGEYRVASSVWAIAATFVVFGTSTLVTVDVARDINGRRVHLGPVLAVRAIAFVTALVPIALLVVLADYPPIVIQISVVLGISVLISMVGELGAAVLTGVERLDLVAVVDVVVKLTVSIAMVVAVIVSPDPRLVAGAGLVGMIVYAVFVAGYVRGRTTIDFSADWTRVRDVARRAVPFLTIAVVVSAYRQLDVIVMERLVDSREIGWYSNADAVFSTLAFAPYILATTLLPVLARTHAADETAAADLLRRAFNGLVLIAVPVGLGTAVVAPAFTSLAFGDEFAGAGSVLAVYGVVLVFTSLTTLLGHQAVSIGLQRLWSFVMIAAVVLTIPLDLVLVPWTHRRFDNGAIGGALAFVVTEAVILTIAVAKVAPQLRSRETLIRVGKVALCGAIMVAACWPVRNGFILITVAIGFVTYGLAIVALRVADEGERVMFRRVTDRVPLPFLR